ncbi:MAG: TIGR01906 family membrane protein [Erysipelotrichaceae bacterium]
MQILKKSCYYLVAIGCIVVLFLTSIDLNVRSESFFVKQYQSLDLYNSTGMNQQDYVDGTMALVEYVQGKRDSIQIQVNIKGSEVDLYNEREIAHMVDVLDLYQNAMFVRNGMLVLVVIALLGIVILETLNPNRVISLYRALVNTSKVLGVALACLLIVALLDFNLFWNTFHHIFFTNDLWLLNPATDWMIRMFPLELFYALVFNILFTFIAGYMIIYIPLRIHMKRGSRNEKDFISE